MVRPTLRDSNLCCALLSRIQTPQHLSIYVTGAATALSPTLESQVADLICHCWGRTATALRPNLQFQVVTLTCCCLGRATATLHHAPGSQHAALVGQEYGHSVVVLQMSPQSRGGTLTHCPQAMLLLHPTPWPQGTTAPFHSRVHTIALFHTWCKSL